MIPVFGSKADEHEQARRREVPRLVRHDVAQLEVSDQPLLVALDLIDDGVPNDFDLGIREQSLLKNLRRAQLVATVNEIHLLRVAREEIRFFGRRVTAADDGDRMPAEKRAVADRAVRHSLPRVLDLAGNAQLDRRAAGRDDDTLRNERVARVRSRLEHAVRSLLHRLDDDTVSKFGAELRGVIGEFLRELVPEHVLEAGIVLDHFGVEQLAARKSALEHDRLQHGASGVHAGAHAGRSRADDDDVVLIGRGQFRPRFLGGLNKPAS